MQDNAPYHAAIKTIQELEERHSETLPCPPNFPGLNIIKQALDIMRHYIGGHFPEFITCK